AFGIKFLFVAECDRFQRKDRFTRFVHRFDLRLETLRRDDRAELTVAIDDYSYAPGNGYSTNAGDKRLPVSSLRADADFVRLAAYNSRITNIDIITPLD